MKVDFSRQLNDLDGKGIPLGGTPEPVATLRDVALMCLGMQEQDGEKKLKLFDLMIKVHPGGELELLPEEIAFIKDRIKTSHPSPLIVGRACELLNG